MNILKARLLQISSSHRQDFSDGEEDRRTDLEFQNCGQSMALDIELDIEKKNGGVQISRGVIDRERSP